MSSDTDEQKFRDDQAVANFRRYLRTPAVHPNPNYADTVKFLVEQAEEIGLQHRTYEYFAGKPVLVLTWIGQEPQLQSVLFNNHMDVVPVDEKEWLHKPFDAVIDENGDIHGRGAQDMRSTSIQYLEAIRRLKKDGVKPRRTVHVVFMPDEEIGGFHGMVAFAASADFKSLNVGFAVDEAFPNEDDVFNIANAEKTTWQFRVHCSGQPGHGSQLYDDTAGEKVEFVLDKFYGYRKAMVEKIQDQRAEESDVISINLTQIQGGVQANVIPDELVLTFDCRLPVHTDVEEWEVTLMKWCKEAGEGVWIEYMQKNPLSAVTKLDETNQYWVAFKKAAEKMNLKLKVKTLIGVTDIRHVRALGIPAIGFSALYNTPNLEHKDNEFLNINIFLKGIQIYYNLMPAIANA
ncbi:hypothetical protein PPYR_03178 [Photinus pyralis]|uniref:Peptidase M20 dimerisation domain-containing protein n=1 Tax=Photinus pyralis TaxID=7054 RepID=A0A5N4A280_PHOPY|nr:aminoacylase-1A-like [Photinus pyralis]KAB0791378.1 hypothetical protein PPYR_03178 [Photinus pyralis]